MEGSLQRSHPCYTAHEISFHSLGSNFLYFKGPGTIDLVETCQSLGFHRSSPKAAKPLRGSTQSNHQPPSLSQPFFLQVKRISGPFPPPFFNSLLALTLPSHCPFISTKVSKIISLLEIQCTDAKSKHQGHCKCPHSTITLKSLICWKAQWQGKIRNKIYGTEYTPSLSLHLHTHVSAFHFTSLSSLSSGARSMAAILQPYHPFQCNNPPNSEPQ